ncbi:sugar phosphate nucleotidyltransferase [Desulfococcaceae bacterium HSG8]|nr:sugar phosphate nucleotidyltransferase [Desulfococcaceae bacterium HSG8]
MILAAGFGTRLLPFTKKTPKPLFTINRRPVLDIIIRSLDAAGCEAVIINTHHLHRKITSFVDGQNYAIPVHTRYEPAILGTGGGIKNAADFWDNRPFMVINSDIITNIDLREVYDFHLDHNHPVTLVLHDYEVFNHVAVSRDGLIKGFGTQSHGDRFLAFTGIQVLDPEVLDFIPEGVFSSSIDAYRKMISAGKKVNAFISEGHDWEDMGTPERYREAAVEKMASESFGIILKPEIRNPKSEICRTKLKGDGSDRKWYRLTAGTNSLIMADHGIREQDETCEADAFVNIGRHLRDRGIPVPEIYLYDTFPGLVFMEDLGDVNLQAAVKNADSSADIISHYKSVIDILVKMSVSGGRGFDRSWTYQTPCYDRSLILEKECRYFVDAFLRGYLEKDVCFEDFEDEFICLADRAIEFQVTGFMHRDMQSRNIMMKNGRFYLIDFQGGRVGPLQYDLASLLIDPYTDLPLPVQARLTDYCIEKLSSLIPVNPEEFRICYQYCCITRNLQMLGAFGFLSRVRGKTYFEEYIPSALKTLDRNLSKSDADFPNLKDFFVRRFPIKNIQD